MVDAGCHGAAAGAGAGGGTDGRGAGRDRDRRPGRVATGRARRDRPGLLGHGDGADTGRRKGEGPDDRCQGNGFQEKFDDRIYRRAPLGIAVCQTDADRRPAIFAEHSTQHGAAGRAEGPSWRNRRSGA
ncbi:MAG: hypothetical protein DI535_31165 [Citrobacter freundii]|nr:MAG: hypothetical protein DI535_31165 [Citrobacter freundii]